MGNILRAYVCIADLPADSSAGWLLPQDCDGCCPELLAGEDDGYLVTYVHDDGKGGSECVIYSAKTMSSQPVARIMLPQRVPYGFHGEFVTEAELASQASSL